MILTRTWLRFFLLPVLGVAAWAQGPPQGRGGPPPTPRAGAPVDLTGYWVSIVTEDWRFRMFTPPKGDFAGVPLNAEGTKVGQAWDPAKDEAAGQQCKSYGMPALMRVAGRFHITWDNDTTLKVEADSGTQTRLLHFGSAPAQLGPPSLQGYSTAAWSRTTARSRGGEGQPVAQDPRGGWLKVVTTDLLPGYLRKNGAPYSNRTTVTEYYDLLHEPDGNDWIVVKTLVDDPVYLTRTFITSTNLRRQRDAAGWNPSACTAR
jgi:hypothetical protein